MNAIASFCAREQGWIVELLRALVEHESPSTDRAPLERCGSFVAQVLERAGAGVTRLDGVTTADHVLARWPGSGAPVLLIGHFDTVWPVGQLARMPVRESDGRLYGPGALDMKGGLAIGVLAVRALIEAVSGPRRPRVSMLVTSDEEVGSHTSRAAIERLAREHSAVLVLEPALPGGAVKTARKGVGEFVVTAHGVSAHSGANPGAGASAIHELARVVTTVEGWNDPVRGVSVNVGEIAGGLRSNVVAERARAAIDVRIARLDDAAGVDRAFRELRPANPRVRFEIEGGINRPPMERSDAVVGLYKLAREVAREQGSELAEGSTGGASDGNFTAAIGVPTLDGLGATGDGPHAITEHVIIKDLPARAALVGGLLARLGGVR